MDYKKWLDKVVLLHKLLIEKDENHPEDVALCLGGMGYLGRPHIHVYGDIKKLAKAVGAETRNEEHDEQYYKVVFEYKDCEVFTLVERC